MNNAFLAVAAVVALAACSDRRAPVESCGDSLAGVWRAPDEDGEVRRYHIAENKTGIEIFAMFDTSVPPEGGKVGSPVVYAPVAFDLRRSRRPSASRGLSGTRSQRMTRDGRVCLSRTRAAIEACRGNQLVLRYERPGAMDWSTCKAVRTEEWVALGLRRE